MIRARNPWILTALDKLCEDCDIAVEEENMELMDMIIADLRDGLDHKEKFLLRVIDKGRLCCRPL